MYEMLYLHTAKFGSVHGRVGFIGYFRMAIVEQFGHVSMSRAHRTYSTFSGVRMVGAAWSSLRHTHMGLKSYCLRLPSCLVVKLPQLSPWSVWQIVLNGGAQNST